MAVMLNFEFWDVIDLLAYNPATPYLFPVLK